MSQIFCLRTSLGHQSSYEEAYLIDGDNSDGICTSISNFKVLCIFRNTLSYHAATFTVGGASSSWSNRTSRIVLGIDDLPDFLADLGQGLGHIHLPIDPFSLKRKLGHAGGSWYFHKRSHVTANSDDQLIQLDGTTGEFSLSELSLHLEDGFDFHYSNENFYVAECLDDGKPRIVAVFDETLKVFTRVGDGDWALEKSIILSEATRGLPGYKPAFFEKPMNILTRGPGFVILSPQALEKWLVSVDLETMEVALAEEDMGTVVYGCQIPWPPALNDGV